MRLVIRPPQTLYTLLTLLFFFGALSLSSIFHDESKLGIRIAIQALIFSTALLLIITSGARSVKSALLGVPITIALSLWTSSQYPIHLFLLTLICLILIRRSERLKTDAWAHAIWIGSIGGLIVNIILGKYGISESKIYYVITSETTKNSMGFFNPNIAALLSASTVIFSSLAKKRINWIISVTIFAYVLSETYARTAAMMIAIYYLNTTLIYKLPTSIKRATAVSIQALGMAIIVFIMFMELAPNITQTELFAIIDRTFSYRLTLAIPNLVDSALFFPGEAPPNMDFALANVIIVFGGIPLISFLALSIITSLIIEKDHVNFYLMCNMICFASLFSENIAYIYMPIGLIFAIPFAYVVQHLISIYIAMRAKSPKNMATST